MNQGKTYIHQQLLPEPSPIITTSWDDGHPLDFKLAELLQKYNLKATFYIPKTNEEHDVMDESSVAELSKHFEIGGHTLHHKAVPEISPVAWQQEVKGCSQWLSQLLQEQPVSFCFPKGHYNDAAAAAVFQAGYKLARTTELLSTTTDPSKTIIGTTIQVYHHSKTTYIKHLIKRGKFSHLLQWLASNGETDIETLTEYYVNRIINTNGCFHLWGHSWEIEEYNLWNKLELVFQKLANIPGVTYKENRQLLPTSV